MLNRKEKQYYTKQDLEFFDTLSKFKKNDYDIKSNIIFNECKITANYTNNDYNNFDNIIKNYDTNIIDHILDNSFQKQKDSDYTKNDLKNFQRLNNQFHSHEINHENFNDKIQSTNTSQINYKKNDLENFDQIIKNEEGYEKNLVKIVNVGGRKNPKLKNDNPNLKKIKILYFD